MDGKTMCIVHWIRTIFYCAAIVVLVAKCCGCEEKLGAAVQDQECFWPPDMIPHPTAPDEESEIVDGKPKEWA